MARLSTIKGSKPIQRCTSSTRRPRSKCVINSMLQKDWPPAASMSKYEDLQYFFQSSAKSPSTVRPKHIADMDTRRNVQVSAIAGPQFEYPPLGEWPATFSQSCYESLAQHYHDKLFKKTVDPSKGVDLVMTRVKYVAKAEDKVSTVIDALTEVTGVPVITDDTKVIGVLSQKDISIEDYEKRVGDLMSSPAITIEKKKTVSEAAGLMLKHNIHRLPIIEKSGKCIGIVTRTDIFEALGV